MDYRREIDGLRAVAVLPVILFHAGFKAFEGGFVGVDIFFVISGYLITTIILADMNKGKFSLVTFYERRARRILPALFFVMACCFPFAWLWLSPIHFQDFAQSLAAVSVFSSNILFWQESGYFDTAAELKPLLHTWSLAVEEQYYLLFPLFLMLIWKFRKRFVFGFLMLVALASMIFSQWGAYNEPAATFFLLPTRGWELALGALIAFHFVYKREQVDLVASRKLASEFFGLIGLLLICCSIFSFDKSTPFPSLYALAPTLGTVLIIVFSSSSTIVGRLLAAKPMVGIGLISYSAYLWHQPIFVFARHRSLTEPNSSLLVALSILSIVLAYFSWRFVEMPFRNRDAINRKNIFTFSVVGSVFFAATGLAGHLNGGFDTRTNRNGVVLGTIPEKVQINNGLSDECEDKFTLSPNCRTSDEPEILVWGDSYAMHLVQGIIASNPSAKIIQMTKSNCGPLFDAVKVDSKYPVNMAKECLEFNSSVHEWLKSDKTVKYVVISSLFSRYLGGTQLLVEDEIHQANDEMVTDHLIRTLEELKGMGVNPVIFSPTPRNGENIGECLVKAELFDKRLEDCNFNYDEITRKSKEVNKFLDKIADKHKVIFIDEGICQNGICQASIDSTFIYRDSGHLSKSGSSLLGKKMGFYDLIVN